MTDSLHPLDARLLEAHARDDKEALVRLYSQASTQAETPDAAAFYLTHAHVFALEIGHPDTLQLRARLVADGREEPL